MKESFNYNIYKSIVDGWDFPALGDLNEKCFTYGETAVKIARIHIYFKSIGLKPGDKVALCGRNSVAWAVAFFATVTYGAVIVPILNEFKPDNIHHLLNHSESRLFFADESIWEQLRHDELSALEGVLNLKDFTLLFSRSELLQTTHDSIDEVFKQRYPDGYGPEQIDFYKDSPDELMLINYTSGSTGFSKGVMLSYGNLMSNARFAIDEIPFLGHGDGMLSMLPMAHMYGLLVELIFPFMKGAHITFLGKVPSPKILLGAFATVKPQIVITVPLVIEKMVEGKVFPMLKKPSMRMLCSIPFVKRAIYKKIKGKLIDAFGGKLSLLVIGGAALSVAVENFLRNIRFPYTVGYGMTECAPLISYSSPDIFKARSCGRPVDRMEVKVESADPENIPGELWVRGANVMKGYYKNQEATDAIFKDGWMNTGDMCTRDKDGFIYIKGRSKTMILGPSGQNIYPEEIEGILNHYPLVAESLVVEREGGLVALVLADAEKIKSLKLTPFKVESQMDENLVLLNKELPTYSRVKQIELVTEPFEKTPKHSIKRYLYK